MRKKIITNTTIPIELKISLLGFGHFAYPRLVFFSHLTFAQWIQKFNDFLLKLVDIFRFFVININIAVCILSVFRGTNFKWFSFDGKLFQQLSNLSHVLQRKFGHIERDVRKIIFAVQNKKGISIFQLFTYCNRSLRNFCWRIYDNVKRFCFYLHRIKKFSSPKNANMTFPIWCPEQDFIITIFPDYSYMQNLRNKLLFIRAMGKEEKDN